MLTDLIIGVICKILATFFTFVYLQIAYTNYLFLTLQTTGAPYVLRGIYILMEHTWRDRKKKKNRHLRRPCDPILQFRMYAVHNITSCIIK